MAQSHTHQNETRLSSLIGMAMAIIALLACLFLFSSAHASVSVQAAAATQTWPHYGISAVLLIVSLSIFAAIRLNARPRPNRCIKTH